MRRADAAAERRFELHPLLVRMGKHDGVVKGRRLAAGDVNLEQVGEAGRINLHELTVGEVDVAAGEG